MATCRNQSVSRKLVSMGLMGTTISLILEGLASSDTSPMSEAQTSYIEQLIACVANLCASCDEAVEELSRRQFCGSLVQVVSSTTLAHSIRRAAAQCLHTSTENQPSISQSLVGLEGGVGVLVSAAEHVRGQGTEEHGDEQLCSLYCCGALTNICGSLPSDDPMDLTTKMQQLLPILLRSLQPSDDTLNTCISPTIDAELSESQQQQARQMPLPTPPSDLQSTEEASVAVEMEEGEGESPGGDGGRGEEVYVGGEVDKPWTGALEVVELAAEVLANVAVVVKECCMQGDEQAGDYEGGAEWVDDDENERRMEAIAALKSVQQQQQQGDEQLKRVDVGVFDARGGVAACLTVLGRLHSALSSLSGRCEQNGVPLSSSSAELMAAAEKTLTALSNLLHLVGDWKEADVTALLTLLLDQFDLSCALFRGVTPSVTSSHSESASPSGTSGWELSPLLDAARAQSLSRALLAATTSCLATLHRMPVPPALLSLEGPSGKVLRGRRLVTLLRGVSSVPLWEAAQHCLDLVCFLASTELTTSEVKVVSNALLRRLADPSALRASRGGEGLCDASILVMEGTLSAFIDLHSSDDPEVYQVYQSLQAPTLLQQAFSDFKNKVSYK